MPFVDEQRTERAGATVEVLVRAPRGDIDAPVVEREFDVARGVGEVPADDRPGRVTGCGQPFDLEGLPRREVDAGEEDQRELTGVLRDRTFQVRGPDRVLARAWPDHDEIRSRIQPARREVAVQSVPVGREERRIHQDPPSRPLGPEERGEQQVDVDGQRVEDRDLERTGAHDPGHRLAQRVVEREPRPLAVPPALDTQVRPTVQLGFHGRARRPRLEPQRLPGEVDRRWPARTRRPVGQMERVAPHRQRIGGVPRERVSRVRLLRLVRHGSRQPRRRLGRTSRPKTSMNSAWLRPTLWRWISSKPMST